jgi:trimeric autotransporter adhesin
MKYPTHFNSTTGFALVGRRTSRSLFLFTLLTAASATPSLAQYAAGGVTNGSSGTTAPVTTATGIGAVAIGGGNGTNATASKAGAIAIGEAAIAKMENDLSIGKQAQSNGTLYENGCVPSTPQGSNPSIGAGAFSIGLVAKSTGYGAMALGTSSSANGNNSVAIGGATIGDLGNECSNQSVAIGVNAHAGMKLINTALRGNSIAIGMDAKAVFDGVALGGLSDAYGDHSIAIGVNAKTGESGLTNGAGAIAIGSAAKARAVGAIAAGSDAIASGVQSTAIGKSAAAGALQSVAIGPLASANETNAIAIGASATSGTGKTHAVAVGAAASTAGGQPYDVALGFSSTSAPLVAASGLTINGLSYSFAGATPVATVSIGNVNDKRTLTNVAAGQITPTSTDAINGSQLDAAIQALKALKTAFDAYKATHP